MIGLFSRPREEVALASLLAGSAAWLSLPSAAHAAPAPVEAPSQPEVQRPSTASATVVAPVVAPEAEGREEVPVAPPPAPVVAEPTQPPSQPVVTTAGPIQPASAPEPLPATDGEVTNAMAPKPGLELPERTGRRLMMGSFAAGGVGWAMSLGTMGLIGSDCSDCVSGLVTLTGLRWLANGTAMGLAIPAGVFRGRYDAIDSEINGDEPRNTDAFVVGGGAAIGVGAAGWVLSRIGLFTFIPDNCSDERRCIVGYLAALQTSFALASAGSGMLSYGLAHREQKRKLGRAVQVRVVPQLSSQYSGLSLAGRF